MHPVAADVGAVDCPRTSTTAAAAAGVDLLPVVGVVAGDLVALDETRTIPVAGLVGVDAILAVGAQAVAGGCCYGRALVDRVVADGPAVGRVVVDHALVLRRLEAADGQVGEATNVTIANLTIRGFKPPQDQGVVNHDSADGWTIRDNTIENNKGAAVMAGAHQKLTATACAPTASTASTPTSPATGSSGWSSRATRSPATTPTTGRRSTRLRLQRWREVLGGQRRRHPRQLGARQPRRRALGRHQQQRHPHRGQRHREQRRRSRVLRDELQPDHA